MTRPLAVLTRIGYHLTPDRLVLLMLAVEGLLWLSDRLGWPVWHKGYAVLTAVASVGVAFLLMLAWFAVALIFRWRFQFSIRSLLVLVVVVAVPCSWLAVDMKKAREQAEAVATVWKLGWLSGYDYQTARSGLPGVACLRNLLGLDFFSNVDGLAWTYSTVTDAALENIRGLRGLQRLFLRNTKITDAGLKNLRGLASLQLLEMTNTKVTDSGLEQIKGLSQLQWLDMRNTKVTDSGLEQIKGLSQLQWLYLDGTQVTDAGLDKLSGLTKLEELRLRGTKVTDAGVKKLQHALPKCAIQH